MSMPSAEGMSSRLRSLVENAMILCAETGVCKLVVAASVIGMALFAFVEVARSDTARNARLLTGDSARSYVESVGADGISGGGWRE